MRSNLYSLAQLSEGDVAAWRDLAESSIESNPFGEPEFLRPAVERLGGAGVELLVAQDDRGWAACLPVHRPSSWRKVPLRPLAAWRHPYCFLGTPLVAADRAEAGLDALVFHGVRARQVGALALEWLDARGAVMSCLETVLSRRGLRMARFEQFERAALARRPEPTYLEQTLTGHRRRELQRLGRGLEREAGGTLEVHDRSGDARAVEEFLRLEESGWKGRERTALASDSDHAHFFREVCGAFRARERLQLYELSAGGRTVALKCNLLAGSVVFCFKIAYNDEYARYSPGVQLEVAMVGLFHEQADLTAMDSCAEPDNQMINRLWPDRRTITSILVTDRRPLGRAARYGVSTAAAVRRRVRSA